MSGLRSAVAVAVKSGNPVGVADVRSKLVAVEEYLRRRGGFLLQGNEIAVARMATERWLGDWTRLYVRRGSHAQRLPPGVTRNAAVIFRRLAAIPQETFDSIIAARRASVELTTALVLRLAGAGGKRAKRALVRVDVEDAGITIETLVRSFPEVQRNLKGVHRITRGSRIVALIIVPRGDGADWGAVE